MRMSEWNPGGRKNAESRHDWSLSLLCSWLTQRCPKSDQRWFSRRLRLEILQNVLLAVVHGNRETWEWRPIWLRPVYVCVQVQKFFFFSESNLLRSFQVSMVWLKASGIHGVSWTLGVLEKAKKLIKEIRTTDRNCLCVSWKNVFNRKATKTVYLSEKVSQGFQHSLFCSINPFQEKTLNLAVISVLPDFSLFY